MTSRAKRILSASTLAMVLTAMSSTVAFATPTTAASNASMATAATAATAPANTVPATAVPASVGTSIGARVATTKSKITVTRTAANALRVAWPKRAGATSYVVIASGAAGELASATTRATSATISDLKAATRYTFIITPMKGSSALKPMRAVMLQPLTGATTAVPSSAVETTPDVLAAVSSDTDQTPAPTTPSAPPAVAPAPTTPPAPSTPTPPRTVTIWECPDGFTEQSDGSCLQARAYTFHDVVDTRAYTFHGVWVQTGPTYFVDHGAPDAWGSCAGRGHLIDGRCGTYDTPGRTDQVKDEPPAGFTDDDTQWTRTITVKDDAPDGFTDDGSQWTRTTAKVSRQIPA